MGDSAKRADVVVATNNCPYEDLLGSQAVGSATRGATLNPTGTVECPRVERPCAVAAAVGLAGHCARAKLRPEASERQQPAKLVSLPTTNTFAHLLGLVLNNGVGKLYI